MRLPFFFFFLFLVGLFVLLQTAGLQNTIFWLHHVFWKAFCLWVAQIKTTYEYKAFLGQDGTFIWWLFMLKVIAPDTNLFDSQKTELAYNHFLCVIMEGYCWGTLVLKLDVLVNCGWFSLPVSLRQAAVIPYQQVVGTLVWD